MDSKIDLSQVKPLNHRVTAALVNQFIVSTTQFLNRFGTRCDSKLRRVEDNMNRIYTSLNILEAKLNSIPQHEPAKPSSQGQAAAPAGAPAPPPPPGQPAAPGAPPPPPPPPPPPGQGHAPAAASEATVAEAPAAPPAPPVEEGPKLKDDPRFSKYFKMIKMGVPLPAVKQKMVQEGIDASYLDKDPESPAPPGAPPPPGEAPDSDEQSDEFDD